MPEDDNGRDYTLRIDARVTDASGREVSGKGRVVGTCGDFLLADVARSLRLSSRRSARKFACAPSTTRAKPRANVPVAVRARAHQVAGAATAASRPDDGASAGHRCRPTRKAARRGRRRFPTGMRKLPLRARRARRASARSRTKRARGSRVHDETANRRRRQLSGAGCRPGVLRARRDREAADSRRRDRRHRARHEGSAAIAWHQVDHARPGAAIEVPDRRRRHRRHVGQHRVHEQRSVVSRREGKLRVPPKIARRCRCRSPRRRRSRSPRDPGVFTITTTDAAGAPVRAQVSLAVVDEAVFAVKPDDTPDPLRFFYRREYSRVGDASSRATTASSAIQRTQQLQLARRRRPFSLADFKADRSRGPPCARSSRMRSIGSADW